MEALILVAEKLIGMAVELVGKETVRGIIDKQTEQTADAAADAIELARFGKTSHTP